MNSSQRIMPSNLDDTSPIAIKSTDTYQDFMQDLMKQARLKGATDVEVAISKDSGFSVDVRLQEVETVHFSDAQSLALTIYIGHQKGSASASDWNPKTFTQLIDAAYDIALQSEADPCFGLAEKSLLSATHPDLELYHPWKITPEKAITLAKDCEKIALSNPAITNSDGVNVSTYTMSVGYANTHGASGMATLSSHAISCSLIAGKNEQSQRDYDYSTCRDPRFLTSIEVLAKCAAKRTTARLNPKKIKTGHYPILFDTRISGHLMGLFIQAISGSALYRKQSFLLDSLGKPVFPTGFHIQEFPYLKGKLGSSAFDTEGVTTRDNIFVEDGIIQQYVLSSYTARRLGLQTTANAGGVHNLTVKPTHSDFKSLLKTMDKGLLITEMMGDGVHLQTGDYSRGAFGFWVEKGKIQYPVEGVTIAGNLSEMFKRIIGVGADCDPNRALQCGSILIESMMVGGE